MINQLILCDAVYPLIEACDLIELVLIGNNGFENVLREIAGPFSIIQSTLDVAIDFVVIPIPESFYHDAAGIN